MKILAASTVDAVNTFLHAGYISAYPHSMWTDTYGTSQPDLELDLVQALEIKASAAARLVDGDVQAVLASVGHAAGAGLVPQVAALAGVAGLALLARPRDGQLAPTLSPRTSAAVVLSLLATVAVSPFGCEPALPEDVPWEGVALQEYVDPAAATQALLHGVIADALRSMDRPVETLPNIQDEVGLPSSDLTDGMAYALTTYGLDGWGHEFQLEILGDLAYRVTSAGPDGAFGGDDDVALDVTSYTNDDWDYAVPRAFFLDSDGSANRVFFHRFNGDLFEYGRQADAEAATGSDLYDVFLEADLSAEQVTEVHTRWAAFADETDHEPLVLQVFDAS